MDQNITPDRFVEVAVQLESAGSDLYSDMARVNSETRSLFENLAQAEAKHAELYKSFDSDAIIAGEGEELNHLEDLVEASPLDLLRESGSPRQGPLNLDEAFPLAIQFEKETVLFYSAFTPLLSEEAKEINQKILAQEKEHLRKVLSARKRIQTVR